MNPFEFKNPQVEQEKLLKQRLEFVEENYPFSESEYTFDDLVNDSLYNYEVVESRDRSNDIESLITYAIAEDGNGVKYVSIGIILTREESQGEGLAGEMLNKVIKIAENNNCEYIVAKADTNSGENFLANNDFYNHIDEVNGVEHLRFDL